MFELLTGKPPFETPSHTETYKKILAADYTVPLEISEEAKDHSAGPFSYIVRANLSYADCALIAFALCAERRLLSRNSF